MRASVCLLVAAGALGCKALEPPPPPPQVINFRVYGDPGKPLANADLVFNGKKIATTDAEGLGQLKLGGRDGEAFDITVVCPQGFLSPPKPIPVILKRLSDPTKSPEYTAACPPTTRTIVVAVRADNGADLPVTYLGREVARTDSSGAAHVLLKFQPGDQFDLMLSTSSDATLRPQNPVASFVVGQRDDVMNFDQKFEHEVQRQVRWARPVPKGPQRIPR